MTPPEGFGIHRGGRLHHGRVVRTSALCHECGWEYPHRERNKRQNIVEAVRRHVRKHGHEVHVRDEITVTYKEPE